MRMQFGKVHFPGYKDAGGYIHTCCGLFGEEMSNDPRDVTCDECKRFSR